MLPLTLYVLSRAKLCNVMCQWLLRAYMPRVRAHTSAGRHASKWYEPAGAARIPCPLSCIGSGCGQTVKRTHLCIFTGQCHTVQEPAGAVYANVSVSSAKRGTVFPETLSFTTDDWNVPKARAPCQCGRHIPDMLAPDRGRTCHKVLCACKVLDACAHRAHLA